MILELKGIYKDYQQGKMSVPVLKDINFSMEEFMVSIRNFSNSLDA